MTSQRIAGRYEVVRLLGEGPLGKVYEVADHRREGRKATLKILRAELIDDGELDKRRAGLGLRLQDLRHPGINALAEVGKTPLGLVFLTSGYAEGENLRALLARRGPLPDARVLAIARGLLEALAAAHAARLPHGDLHPGNVLLKSRVQPTLEDPFGTSVLLLDHGQLGLVGAPRPPAFAPYAAPELAEGAAAGPAADVYAAGKILLELATGRTDADPRLLAPPLGPLLVRALDPRPAERFPDARAFLAALPPAQQPTDTGAALAAARAQLEASETRRAALEARAAELEQSQEHTLSTTFVRLAQRDAALAETRRELMQARASIATDGELRAEVERRTSAEQDARRELEELKRKPPPKTARVLAGTFALAAIAASLLWLKDRGGTAVAAGPEQASRELEQKDAQLAAAAAELETWKESERNLREATAKLTSERDAALAQAEAGAREIQAREALLSEARLNLSASETALSRARDPDLVALDQVDRVLAALAEGDGQAARARYQALTITHPELEALSGLDRLTAVALALDEAGRAEDVLKRCERLDEAETALVSARAEDGVPALARAPWILKESDARAGRIQGSLAELGQRSTEARAEFSAALEQRWQGLLAQSLDTEPREVLAIADWFGDGRLLPFLDRFAESLRGAAERGGSLELSELLHLRHLEEWGDAIAARPELAGHVGAREVQLFRYARAWRNGPATEDPPALPVVFQTAEGGTPKSGWRADLALRARLTSTASVWPGAVGSRFLYRSSAELEDTDAVTWQLDEVTEAAPAAWTLRRRFYREDGSFLSESTVKIERRGKRYVEEQRPGGPVFDVGSDRAQRVSFVPGPDVPPPEGLVDAEQWRAFRAELAKATPEALRYDSGGLTGWFSPEWGCLAVESPERFRRELAHAAPARP